MPRRVGSRILGGARIPDLDGTVAHPAGASWTPTGGGPDADAGQLAMTVDDVTVFPVWAVILGFPIAALWRWIAGAAPRPVVLVELGAKDQRPGLRIPVTPTEAQEGPDPPAVPFTSSISEGTQTGTSTGSSVLVPCFN